MTDQERGHWITFTWPYQGSERLCVAESHHTGADDYRVIRVMEPDTGPRVRAIVLERQKNPDGTSDGDLALHIQHVPTPKDWSYLASLWPLELPERPSLATASLPERELAIQQAIEEAAVRRRQAAENPEVGVYKGRSSKQPKTAPIRPGKHSTAAGASPVRLTAAPRGSKEDEIKWLLEQKKNASPDDARKIRKRLRDLGYRISDNR